MIAGGVCWKEARQRRDECRHTLASGLNPSDTRKTEHAVEVEVTADSLETVAREGIVNLTLNRQAAPLMRR